MNILMVASDNDRASGAFLSMVRLTEILRNEFGHNVYIVVSRDGNGELLLNERNIPYFNIRAYNWIIKLSEVNNVIKNLEMEIKFLLNNISIYKLKKLINELDIDVVHINTSWTYVGAIAAKKCGIPYVWHIREFLEEDQKVTIKNKKYGYKVISGASRIISISDSIKKKYVDILKTNNLRLIYNGIDEGRFYSSEHEVFKSEQLTFVIVGTINESKGQRQLIEACGILKKRGINSFLLEIVGVGKEDYLHEMEKLIEINDLKNNVHFCGYQSTVEKFYKMADITFVCSKAEAFGRVTVEAMMSGSLVIGANTAATKELIKHMETGLLYEENNVIDLADKVEWALSNRMFATKVAYAGREYMLENMTAKSNAYNINALYQEIVMK